MSYYSGQGILYVAERNTDGTPKGFRSLGNVPSLEISIEITKFEHTESMSGQRATDLTIVQEKKGTFTMTLEDMSPANLAMAMWGANETTAAGTAATASGVAYLGMRSALPYPKVSNVVVKDETDATTYEFGTSESDPNSKNGWIDETSGSYVVFTDADQTAKGAASNIAEGDVLHFTFDHEANTITHAFTQTSLERWLRFEGLNTIDGNPVIVDIFKASLDPLAGYPLINEELASFDVSGSVLYDTQQTGTSKFFRQINV